MNVSKVAPILRMFDEDKAKEFYVDLLGFSIDWEQRFADGLPLYMQVSKDGCVLHLSEHYSDSCPGSAMRIQIDDIEAYFMKLQAKQEKHKDLQIRHMPWGSIDMSILDPFGNRLIFTNAIST
jgi:uncharacterized glyoxalase superfamily protein PhnB